MSLKFDFDGPNLTVHILDGVTDIDVKTELYSDYSDWYNSANNARFVLGMEAVGNIPISDIQNTAEFFFFINGWKLSHTSGVKVSVSTNLFTLNEDKIVAVTSGDSQIEFNNTDAVVVSQDDLLTLVLAIKNKVDLMNFVGSKVVVTLDGEKVTTDDESRKYPKATIAL